MSIETSDSCSTTCTATSQSKSARPTLAMPERNSTRLQCEPRWRSRRPCQSRSSRGCSFFLSASESPMGTCQNDARATLRPRAIAPYLETTGMKAVGYKKSLPVDDADSLIDFEVAKPEPRGRDIRVAVKAISANPVDYKVRKRAAPPEGETKILGYDAAGIVDAVGPEVTLFKAGDEVFYVGSILIQLARRLTGLTVVATASRPESQKWCLDLGAHAVIDHAKPMKEQIEKPRLPPVALIASLTNTDQHYKALAEIIAPQGKFGLIDDPGEFNVSVFKGKAVSIHWESMFTRSSFQTPDMIGQHALLNDVADLIDKGVLRTTLDQTFGTINAANLKRAHALLESGKSRGKIVLEGW